MTLQPFFKFFRTIKSKQLTLAVLVSVLPLLVLGHLVNLESNKKIRSEVRNELSQVARDKAQAIQQWLAERKADIHILATTRVTKSLLEAPDAEDRKAEFHHFFDILAEQYGVYKLILVFDKKGQIIDSYPSQLNLDPVFVIPENSDIDESVISDAFLWNGKAHISINAHVRIGSDIVGRIAAYTSLEAVNDITNNIIVGDTGEAYVVDSSGNFLTHRQSHRVLVENIANVQPIKRLLSRKEESFVGEFTDYRGIPVLGAYHHFKDSAWSLVTEQDVEEAFASAYEMNQTIILLVLSTICIAGLAAFFLTSRNLKPLTTFKQTIEKIRQGSIDVRFPVRKQDEIGITGDVFNKMLVQLQTTQEKLQQRVKAADRELLRAHDELQMRHIELKNAQKKLLRIEKLSTMGEIAAGLAHEINNPLATIKMLVNSLGTQSDGDSEERSRELSIISQEIERIAAMIGRFMDLTHPLEMRFEPIVLERVVDRTIALLRPKLKEAQIVYTVTIPQELPVVVGDESHLGQLIMNLILNSINAMPQGGEIFIKAEEHTKGKDGRRYLRISVCDTGVGIPDEYINQIFNPFFTTRANGTGLGLSIVFRIAENHGGRISVHSTPGIGTTFIVDFPESEKRK